MATKKAASTKKRTTAAKPATVRPKTTTKTTVTTAPAAAKTTSLSSHIQDSAKSMTLWRALAAELIGTFLLAGVVLAGQGQPIFVLFAYAGIMLLLGAVSGAHVNPAVTIGALVTRRIGWLRAVGYIIAQILGAALAYTVMSGFIGGANAVSAQAAAYGQSAPTLFAATQLSTIAGKEWFVFFAELTGAAVLGFTMANVTRLVQDRIAKAFTAGLGLFIALMIAVSAASYVGGTAVINPATAIALHAYNWGNVFTFAVYILAPVIGAVVGFIVHDLLRDRTVVTE